MIKHEKYKPSGIELLESIPTTWEVGRIKDICKMNEKSLTDKISKDYQFKYVDISNVNQNGLIQEPETVTFSEAPSRARRIVREKDIIISTVRTYLKAIAFFDFYPKDYIASTGFAVLTPNKKIGAKFLAFYSQSEFFVDLVIRYSTGVSYPAINSTTLSCLYVHLPSRVEQNNIDRYLDAKTQAIDKKVKLLTKKTDYYKELRKSIINDAVCKGLDKNVTLQESEFIFSVNANWKRYRLKDLGFLYSGLSGKAGDDFNQNDNPNNKGFIPFTNIANNTYLKSNHLGAVVVSENEKQNKVRKGDLFFLMSSESYEDIGKTAALAEDIPDTYLNSFCKGYRIIKKNCEPYFLNYLLLSDNYRKSLITEGKGFTRINLKMEKVTDFFVYLPPTKEQQIAIATYLDEKTQKIDVIVTNIRKQIETFKELRKTLINDVVTGKIKVTK